MSDPATGTAAMRLFAPAKLTRKLRVTGVRPDGYHLIDAEMVTLDWGDDIEISPGSGVTIRGEGDTWAGVPDDDDNLVAKALRLCGRHAQVTIHKRIPPGAGLGGGSADAAAILRWAGFADLDAAASIGADVAFCLVGGRARVQGIGEEVMPLEPVDLTFTLLTPPIMCPTPLVYAKWDALGGPVGDNGNDLEPAALAVEPDLARWRDLLGNRSGQRPKLAGSGSTWFVEGAFPGEYGPAGKRQQSVVVRTTLGWTN